MSWIEEHWLAAVFLSLYVLVLFRNAYLGSRASSGMAGYYVGNRELSGTIVGISFFATFASTNTFIGHAGKSYEYGIAWFTLAILLIIFSWLSWRWIAPPLRRFASEWDALTIPDFIGSRFVTSGSDRHPVLIASAVVIVFASILYLLAIFKGAGHLFQLFLGIPYDLAVGVTLVIVVLYTSIGGFVSVVRTDAIQGVMMLIGGVTIFYFVTKAAGGVTAVSQLTQMPDKRFLFDLNGGIPFAILLGISLSGSLKLIVDPRQLSRFYGLKDEQAVKQGIWVAVLGLTLILATLFPVGIYAHLILDNVTDTDLIIPTLVNDPEVFPMWVTDLLIVSIVSAAMSSMDSVLLVASSTLYKNLIAPFRTNQHELRWTRGAVVVFAAIAAGMALNPPGDIVTVTIFSGSLYAVCFFPAVVFGLYSSRGSANAVLWSMAVGVSLLIFWILWGWNQYLHEVFPALMASCVTYWVVARSGKSVESADRQPEHGL